MHPWIIEQIRKEKKKEKDERPKIWIPEYSEESAPLNDDEYAKIDRGVFIIEISEEED